MKPKTAKPGTPVKAGLAAKPGMAKKPGTAMKQGLPTRATAVTRKTAARAAITRQETTIRPPGNGSPLGSSALSRPVPARPPGQSPDRYQDVLAGLMR